MLIYSTIYGDVGRPGGLKKPKTCGRNTWIVPYVAILEHIFCSIFPIFLFFVCGPSLPCLSNSLSKCLKYPGFIFLCPQKLSKKNPRKKTKVLELSKYYPRIFSEFGYVQDFFYVPRTIRGKKTNTLNYPNSIRYFGDLAKFSRILQENKKFYNFFFFVKIWQCLTLCSLVKAKGKLLPNVR